MTNHLSIAETRRSAVDSYAVDPTKNRFAQLLTEESVRGRWFRYALIFAIWALPAILFTSQNYVVWKAAERPIGWLQIYWHQLFYCSLWAAITPVILHLAARYPIEKDKRLKRLLLHLGISCLFAVIQHAFFIFVDLGFPLGDFTPYITWRFFVGRIFGLFDYGVLIYWMILALSHSMDYYKRFQKEELRSSQLEMRLTVAQLQALKMQLHPHFLFNTLHSISALVHRDARTADRMIARLGDFLRMTLESAGSQEVSFQQELDFLQCYLEIEQIRFQDRLTVRMHIDPEARDVIVPNLILQPIVENAIRYAIAPQNNGGLIDIRAERRNGILHIEVKDNGPGLPLSDPTPKEGVGLSNTRARLQQRFGKAHLFQLENRPEGGLMVTFEIPAHGKNNGQERTE
jgi:two-component system LytT family sensor kinase